MKFVILMVLLIAATIAIPSESDNSFGKGGNQPGKPTASSVVGNQPTGAESSQGTETTEPSSDCELCMYEFSQLSLQEMKTILGNEQRFQAVFNEILAKLDTDGGSQIHQTNIPWLQAALNELAIKHGVKKLEFDETLALFQWFDANKDGVLNIDHEAMVGFSYFLTSGIWYHASTIGYLEIQLGNYQLSSLPSEKDNYSVEIKLEGLYTQQANQYKLLSQLEALLCDRDILKAEIKFAWNQNDKDLSRDLSPEEAYKLVISLYTHVNIDAPSQEDFEWGFAFVDADFSGTINEDEFKYAVYLFIIPDLVDSFENGVIQLYFLTAEIDYLFESGLIGNSNDPYDGISEPYWQGYEHGFDDGYSQGFFDATGNYPWSWQNHQQEEDYHKKLLIQRLADDIYVAKSRSRKSGNPFRNNGKNQTQGKRQK